jgi:hypothetical protein
MAKRRIEGDMFERIKSFISNVRLAMFGKQTIQQILGQDVLLSSDMIDRIGLWSNMIRGQAPWITPTLSSLKLERAITREFANVCTSEMETSVSNVSLDKLYQIAVRDLNEQLQQGLALGSFCIKPLGVKTPGVEYVAADSFIPIKIDIKRKIVNCLGRAMPRG